jgi:hypothetical protein
MENRLSRRGGVKVITRIAYSNQKYEDRSIKSKSKNYFNASIFKSNQTAVTKVNCC